MEGPSWGSFAYVYVLYIVFALSLAGAVDQLASRTITVWEWFRSTVFGIILFLVLLWLGVWRMTK
jgi:hypothetical protein